MSAISGIIRILYNIYHEEASASAAYNIQMDYLENYFTVQHSDLKERG